MRSGTMLVLPTVICIIIFRFCFSSLLLPLFTFLRFFRACCVKTSKNLAHVSATVPNKSVATDYPSKQIHCLQYQKPWDMGESKMAPIYSCAQCSLVTAGNINRAFERVFPCKEISGRVKRSRFSQCLYLNLLQSHSRTSVQEHHD